MEKGSFVINGIHSSELKSYIQNRPELPVPRRKVTFQDIGGRSGSLPFDEEAYENTSMQLVLYSAATSAEEAEYQRAVIHEAFDSGTYIPFIPYFDSNKIYMVQLEDMTFSGNRSYGHNQPYNLSLNVKPYKYLLGDTLRTSLSTGVQLFNPTLTPAMPLITIEGIGDCTLVVSGEPFVLKNIVGSIIIDCENEFSYKYNGSLIVNENSKVFTIDYPTLNKGINTLSWSAGFIVSIDPKWRTLI